MKTNKFIQPTKKKKNLFMSLREIMQILKAQITQWLPYKLKAVKAVSSKKKLPCSA